MSYSIVTSFRKRELARLRAQRFRNARRELQSVLSREQHSNESANSERNVNENENPIETVILNDSENVTVSNSGVMISDDHDSSRIVELGFQNNEVEGEIRISGSTLDSEYNELVQENENNDSTSSSEYNELIENQQNISDSSNSESSNEAGEENEYFADLEELRQWALIYPPIPHARLEKLMEILKRRGFPTLPRCAKTFLGTTLNPYTIESFDGTDDFVYFGIRKSLQKYINPQLHEIRHIELLFNVDGLPLFKSSSKQLWPILCKIFNTPDLYKPFPVALYLGDYKPSILESYLEKFVDEINDLQATGVIINDQLFDVSIKAFVCDRPARSFLKCMKGHGGYYACERCEVKGARWMKRTIYLIGDDCILRTDSRFRDQTNSHHHLGVSPLVRIHPNVDLIRQFVLDSMHLLHLGVMKKLLECWIDGVGNKALKLNQFYKRKLSDSLTKIKVPCEFQRSTRTLTTFHKYKSVEFAFILLYAGPVIFKKVLPDIVYKHFLFLHAACRILFSKELATNICWKAKILLTTFVHVAPSIYQMQFMTGIVHNLIHIADDVEYMNCSLSEISSYPFENTLGQIKKLLRNGNKPLSQLCRRINEMSFFWYEKPSSPLELRILRKLKPDNNGKMIIKRVRWREMTLTARSPDNVVLLQNKKIMRIVSMEQSIDSDIRSIKISGKILWKIKALFTAPINSEIFEMWNVREISTGVEHYTITDIKKKMVCIDLSTQNKEKLYVMPLLHT